jgi:hypothetical protein
MNGPDGTCLDVCHEINFGALPTLPKGWSVWWHEEHEHYQAHGPNDWESVITCRLYDARRWCFQASREQNKEG